LTQQKSLNANKRSRERHEDVIPERPEGVRPHSSMDRRDSTPESDPTVPAPDQLSMTIRHYFAALRHHWWILVILPLLTGGLATGMVLYRTSTYTAHAMLLVNPTASAGAVLPNDVMAANLLVRTYGELVTSPVVLDRASKRLGLTIDPEVLADHVTARTLPNTQLVRLELTDTDPQRAADLANAIGSEFSIWMAESQNAMMDASIQALQVRIDSAQVDVDQTAAELTQLQEIQTRTSEQNTRIEQLTSLHTRQLSVYTSLTDMHNRFQLARSATQDRVSVISMAQAPLEPNGPQLWLVALLACALGLALACALVLLVERLAGLVREPSDLSGTSLPVLVSIPRATQKLTVTMLQAPDSPASEAIRLLRTRLQNTACIGVRALVTTSAAPGEGKSLVAANLALAYAQAGQRVILIDGNLHHPRQHVLLNLPQQPGLADLLADASLPVSNLLLDTDVSGLRLLPAGTLPSNPSALLSTERLREVLDNLRKSADFLVIDSPSLQTSADALLLSAYADECVVVAGSGRTRLTRLQTTIAAIRSTRVHLLGVVLTDARQQGYAV
jgi:capsular exopolysaccharide synthesis family protein